MTFIDILAIVFITGMLSLFARAFWYGLPARVTAPPQPQTQPPAFANAADATDDVVLLGEEAARILEHPVLALAFDRVDQLLIDRVRNSAPLDVNGREEAYRLHWTVQQFKGELRQMVGNAKMKRAAKATR